MPDVMMPGVVFATVIVSMIMAVLVTVLLIFGWWLSSLARRLDRVHRRAERTWTALDAALTRRARLALDLATMSRPALGNQPTAATLLVVRDAAVAALQSPSIDPGRDAREYAESALSRALTEALLPEVWRPEVPEVGVRGSVVEAQFQATVARRLHNDAVTTARALRRRRTVRVFRLAGHAAVLIPFEMVDYPDPEGSTWSATVPEGVVSAVPDDALATTLGPWNRPVG